MISPQYHIHEMLSEWEMEISTSSHSRPWDLHIWNLICQRAATNTRASEAEQKGSSKCAGCGKWNAHIQMILNYQFLSNLSGGDVAGHWAFTYLTIHQNIIAPSWNVFFFVLSASEEEKQISYKSWRCRPGIQLSVRDVESFKIYLSLFKLSDSVTSWEEWRW